MGVHGRSSVIEHEKLRIGLDLDETITAAPRMFRILTRTLFEAGHEVHIVTYRPDSNADQIAADLDAMGIRWSKIHHPSGFMTPPAPWKRAIAETYGFDFVIDDDPEVIAALAEVTIAFRIVSREVL